MQRWLKDLVSGIIMLAVSISGYIYSYSIPEGAVSNPLAGAGAYVRLWMALLGILSAILIIKTLRKRPSDISEQTFIPIGYFTIIAVVIYAAIMPYAGYMISTIVFIAATMTIYHYYPLRGQFTKKDLGKGICKYAVISVILTIAIAQVFTRLLVVMLPPFSIGG